MDKENFRDQKDEPDSDTDNLEKNSLYIKLFENDAFKKHILTKLYQKLVEMSKIPPSAKTVLRILLKPSK